MPRAASIWLREQDGYYYTTLKGKKIKLSQDKDEAQRAFHALRAQEPTPEPDSGFRPSFRKLADLFLTHAEQTKAKTTYESQRYFLQSFCDHVKSRKAAELKVADVTTWLLTMNRGGKQKRKLRGKVMPYGEGEQTKLKWGDNSQVTARATVRACLNWAVDQGYLTHNPLGRLKAGSYKRRERILKPEEAEAIKRHIRDSMFLEFFIFLEQTGCRPFSEAAQITPSMIDWEEGAVTFVKHKNARKGKARVIYLTDKAKAILMKRVRGKRADEWVFHTRHGEAFKGNNTVQRIRRLEKVCGIPRFSLYSVRKMWITAALEKGLSSDIVAELAGNSPKIIAKYYSFLSEKKNTLRDAAKRAVG